MHCVRWININCLNCMNTKRNAQCFNTKGSLRHELMPLQFRLVNLGFQGQWLNKKMNTNSQDVIVLEESRFSTSDTQPQKAPEQSIALARPFT